MKNIRGLFAIIAFSIIVFGVPAVASAQWGRNDDDYYGRGRGGRYGNDIRGTIYDLKNRARSFEEATDQRRNGGYRGYSSGNLEALADRFSQAVERLEDAYGRGRNLRNSEDEARRVLDIAAQIDNELYNGRYGNGRGYGNNGYIVDQWNAMSYDLRIIAREYGYRYNGGYRNNRNYPSNGGGWGVRRPSWWPF
jgi:hypothetical protein